MKKNTKDAGLDYLKAAGIKAARDRNAIRNNLEAEFGQKEADKFLKEFYDLCKKGDDKSYDYKNSDYKKSLILTGGFDADIIRKCCNWVKENENSFGKRILDVGCDCGLMTCFLGMAFPDAEILSIDREKNGIKVAEELAENLGVKNITFRIKELSELEEDGFDTVFSMRTAIENGECSEDMSNGFMKQADLFKTALSEYGKLLASKVKDGGKLITIENTGKDTFLTGWLEVLYEAGLTGDVNDYKEILCSEVGETVDYQAFVMTKKQPEESGTDFFLKVLEKTGDFKYGIFTGWNAKLIYETQKGELLEGFKVSGAGAAAESIFALMSVKNDPDRLIFYQNHEGEAAVQIDSTAKRGEIDRIMKDCLESAKKYPSLNIEMLQ